MFSFFAGREADQDPPKIEKRKSRKQLVKDLRSHQGQHGSIRNHSRNNSIDLGRGIQIEPHNLVKLHEQVELYMLVMPQSEINMADLNDGDMMVFNFSSQFVSLPFIHDFQPAQYKLFDCHFLFVLCEMIRAFLLKHPGNKALLYDPDHIMNIYFIAACYLAYSNIIKDSPITAWSEVMSHCNNPTCSIEGIMNLALEDPHTSKSWKCGCDGPAQQGDIKHSEELMTFYCTSCFQSIRFDQTAFNCLSCRWPVECKCLLKGKTPNVRHFEYNQKSKIFWCQNCESELRHSDASPFVKRYLFFFHLLLRKELPRVPCLSLTNIEFAYDLFPDSSSALFIIHCDGVEKSYVADREKRKGIKYKVEQSRLIGDVIIECHIKREDSYEKIFQFAFNTLIDEHMSRNTWNLKLPSQQFDFAGSIIPPDDCFSVTLHFNPDRQHLPEEKNYYEKLESIIYSSPACYLHDADKYKVRLQSLLENKSADLHQSFYKHNERVKELNRDFHESFSDIMEKFNKLRKERSKDSNNRLAFFDTTIKNVNPENDIEQFSKMLTNLEEMSSSESDEDYSTDSEEINLEEENPTINIQNENGVPPPPPPLLDEIPVLNSTGGGPPPPPPPPPPPDMNMGNCPPPPPPPPGMNGIPPPPPPPGMPGSLNINTNKSMALKRLHWTRINHQKFHSSHWQEIIEKAEPNKEFTKSIEKLFKKTKVVRKKKSVNENKVLSVIGSNRANNVEICAKRFKHLPRFVISVRKFIDHLQLDELTVEEVRAIRNLLPSEKERKLIYAYTDDVKKLSKGDQIIFQFAMIPRLPEKINVFLAMKTFPEIVDQLKGFLKTKREAIKDIRHSSTLVKILSIVLASGNILNQGHRAKGNAQGFMFDILPKLSMLKTAAPTPSATPQTKEEQMEAEIESLNKYTPPSFLHFIATQMDNEYEELEAELKSVKASCDLPSSMLESLERDIIHTHDLIEAEKAEVTKEHELYIRKVERFHDHVVLQTARMKEIINRWKRDYEHLIHYYGQNFISEDDFLEIVRVFVGLYSTACKQNLENKLKAKKKQKTLENKLKRLQTSNDNEKTPSRSHAPSQATSANGKNM